MLLFMPKLESLTAFFLITLRRRFFSVLFNTRRESKICLRRKSLQSFRISLRKCLSFSSSSSVRSFTINCSLQWTVTSQATTNGYMWKQNKTSALTSQWARSLEGTLLLQLLPTHSRTTTMAPSLWKIPPASHPSFNCELCGTTCWSTGCPRRCGRCSTSSSSPAFENARTHGGVSLWTGLPSELKTMWLVAWKSEQRRENGKKIAGSNEQQTDRERLRKRNVRSWVGERIKCFGMYE